VSADQSTVVRYLAALDAGDFASALACFADDAIYAVPPPPDAGGGPTSVLRGRDEIGVHFARRGRRDYAHLIRHVVDDGGRVFVAGTVEVSDEACAMFVSSASVNGAGLIERYFTVSTTVAPSDAKELLC
jgi:ketosteroid isomerase-like protein